MAAHPDLAAEQAYIDRAYQRLEDMRADVMRMHDAVIDQGRGGTHQAREERDVIVRTSLQRLERLRLGRQSLCFGRIDRDGGDGDGPEPFYIGRLAVSDADQEPLVVDWRAPVAEAFYRATGREPMGLVRRRHFATDGRTLLGIEDEVFRADGATEEDEGLAGPGALLAVLEQSRSGQMRDIVATVQREQDEIIRAEPGGVLVVQGGPGTGKTAVALHRAAYLLYTHRFPLERQGVLVVGPNQLFLRYIDQVLPSLGESGVALATISGLVADTRPRGVDSPLASRVKGDARMAHVLARAVRDRQRPLRRDLEVGFGSVVLRVRADATAQIVDSVKRRPGTHNSRRRQVETLLFRRLHASSPSVADIPVDELGRELRREPAVAEALHRMWPLLTPHELLHDLYGARPLIDLAARGTLGEAERSALHRPRSSSLDSIEWTPDDIPLIDEARAVLGPVKQRRARQAEDADAVAVRVDPDEVRMYGHIIVDEAQDLSPMALRMLARRSISGSMTLVGDIAQGTSPWAPARWDAVLEHLPSRRGSRVAELSVNYRTPAEIMDVAAAVLAVALPGAEAPRSVRRTGSVPVVVSARGEALPAEVARVAVGELDAVADAAGGRVAVIVPASVHGVVAAALERRGAPWGVPDRTWLSSPITLLHVGEAKGLEFDSVVVVEPARIEAESPQGLRALFVALTRSTRRLAVVHDSPLPVPLADALDDAAVSGAAAPQSAPTLFGPS